MQQLKTTDHSIPLHQSCMRIGLLLALLLMLGGCSQTETPQTPLRIALNVWPGYAHAFLAREKGLFAKHGVAVELRLNQDISQSLEQFKDREVDGVFNVYADMLVAASEGIPLKVVYVADFSDSGDVIIGKPEFTSMADLAGKTIGFEALNSFSHLFVLKALQQAGVEEHQVRTALVPAQEMLTALETGKVDAGHSWEPVVSQARDKGYRILAKAGNVPGIITDILAFHQQVTTERAPQVQAVVNALLEARDLLYSQPAESTAIMARAIGMSETEMSAGLSGIILPNRSDNQQAFGAGDKMTSLQGAGQWIIKTLHRRGQMPVVPDPEQILDARFVTNNNP
jgi:NitT/TauT family transport system substrate-binding protein